MNSFPAAIDSSILSTFRACGQKFFLSHIENWHSKGKNVHLVAGGAYARGLEVARRAFYSDGLGMRDAEAMGASALIESYGAFECPEGSPKSLQGTLGALEFHFSEFPLGSDPLTPLILPSGKRAIEFLFAIPLPITHPESGDPIIYCGRSDMIASFAGGTYIFDDKTCGMLGPHWSDNWKLRGQFSGYCYASAESGIPVSGVIVRGIAIKKKGYEMRQAVCSRSPFTINRWYEQTLRDIQRMVECWKSGVWDFNLDEACTSYGGCHFSRICESATPEAWLPMSFERRRWNPLTREEEIL